MHKFPSVSRTIVRFPSPVSLGIVYPSAPDCFVSKSQTTVAPCLFPAAMSVGECCLGRSRMAACVARKSSAGQTVLRYVPFRVLKRLNIFYLWIECEPGPESSAARGKQSLFFFLGQVALLDAVGMGSECVYL